ncbi:MAG: GNAT family N-acetyltransferase [Peptococcaceae bacterium]|nr:GNAT family N-acetyltransferase [Peptococcaceae bacterium]
MIRPATSGDLDAVAATYRAHCRYEKTHTAYTIFQEDVYPTRADAEKALAAGGLYVYEDDGQILASASTNHVQPPEYAHVPWQIDATDDEVLVLHLLLVAPDAHGRGIGTALLDDLETRAHEQGLKALRLDTGGQNLPAASLYQKRGFHLAAKGAMDVGGKIAHADHLFFEKLL